MAQTDYLVAGHLDGSDNTITRVVTADDLAQAKTALKNLLWESYEPEMSDLWKGHDDDRREVYITFAQELARVERLNAREIGSLEWDVEDNQPVLC